MPAPDFQTLMFPVLKATAAGLKTARDLQMERNYPGGWWNREPVSYSRTLLGEGIARGYFSAWQWERLNGTSQIQPCSK